MPNQHKQGSRISANCDLNNGSIALISALKCYMSPGVLVLIARQFENALIFALFSLFFGKMLIYSPMKCAASGQNIYHCYICNHFPTKKQKLSSAYLKLQFSLPRLMPHCQKRQGRNFINIYFPYDLHILLYANKNILVQIHNDMKLDNILFYAENV